MASIIVTLRWRAWPRHAGLVLEPRGSSKWLRDGIEEVCIIMVLCIDSVSKMHECSERKCCAKGQFEGWVPVEGRQDS